VATGDGETDPGPSGRDKDSMSDVSMGAFKSAKQLACSPID